MMEGPDRASSRLDDEEESLPHPSERFLLACHRCRQRKVKCDRVSPCSHCVKAGTRCSYASGPRQRERRQRVMVSNTYDSKLDAISTKIDELSQRMSQLSHGHHDPVLNRNGANFSDSVNPTEHRSIYTSNPPTPSSSSVDSAPNKRNYVYDSPSDSLHETRSSSPKAEYEGESSLFAHAVFAGRFLQNAITNTTDATVASEMEAVLDNLRSAVQSGKQQSDTLNTLYPHAKPIPPSSSTRNLPLPPVDKVFACFRMAREVPQVATLWLGDFMRPSQFSDHFIKVASPGPATEADLIIVHCGLYWLFCECAKAAEDEETRRDYYEVQAAACEVNLETVLAHLRFHQPTSIDLAYAMGMAALYCLQKNKPSTAWTFITSASHTIQALGLQHPDHSGTLSSEEKLQRRHMFWDIYQTEKMLSLRMGRSSTFRDQDITLARPGSTERPSGTFLAELAPGWINVASIQSRIYDDIYCPGALMQPPHVRTARARGLADELKDVMQQNEQVHERYEVEKGQILGLDFHDIARRSSRVIVLSMLTLIYRSIAPERLSGSAFCSECIDAARETLREHNLCVAAIKSAQGKTVVLETYINWTIMQSPFTPFIILFCHIIETADGSDLEHMRGVVETLESTSTSQSHSTCDKQRRLFKALYEVAVKYVEVTSSSGRDGQQHDGMMWSMAQQQYADELGGSIHHGIGMGGLNARGLSGHMGTMTPTNIPPHQMVPGSEASSYDAGLEGALMDPNALQGTGYGDVDMEMSFSGAQLWSWFNKNQSMMRMLEDT